MEAAKHILSPAFGSDQSYEESRFSPAQSISHPHESGVAEPVKGRTIAGNPFSLEKTDLQRQARLIHENPVRAKKLIRAAGRDPELFGFD